MIIVVMGVCGSGKTTIGKRLAEHLFLPFFDADDFHSKENIKKMSNGIPLTDADREPWLRQLSLLLRQQEEKGGCVLACSALKEKYRVFLQEGPEEKIIWVYLEGTKEVLQERLEKRADHFISSGLLASQLEALEKPVYAHSVSISLNPDEIVKTIIEKIKKL